MHERFLPLAEQDVSLWSAALAEEAEGQLARAARLDRMGRFQLEAAIQSVHRQRAVTGRTDWEAVALLYEGLVRMQPTIGALVGRAAALAEARGAEAGLDLLRQLPEVATYQPYWALLAHLSAKLGRRDEAAPAFERAIGLCEDAAMRAFLIQRADELASDQG